MYRLENTVEQIVRLLLYILPPNLLDCAWFADGLVDYICGRNKSFTETRLVVFVEADDPFMSRIRDKYNFVSSIERQVQRYIRDIVINRCLGDQEYVGHFDNGSGEPRHRHLRVEAHVFHDPPSRRSFTTEFPNDNDDVERSAFSRLAEDTTATASSSLLSFRPIEAFPLDGDQLVFNLTIDLLPVAYRPIALNLSFYRLPSASLGSSPFASPLLSFLPMDEFSPSADAFWPFLDAARYLFAQTYDERRNVLVDTSFYVRGCHRCTLERMRAWSTADLYLLCDVHHLMVYAWREYNVTWLSLGYHDAALRDAEGVYNNDAKRDLRAEYNMTVDPTLETPFRFVRGVRDRSTLSLVDIDDFLREDHNDDEQIDGADNDVEDAADDGSTSAAAHISPNDQRRTRDVDLYVSSLAHLLEEDAWRLYEISNFWRHNEPSRYHEFVQYDYANGRIQRSRKPGRNCDRRVGVHCESLLRATVHPHLPLVFDTNAGRKCSDCSCDRCCAPSRTTHQRYILSALPGRDKSNSGVDRGTTADLSLLPLSFLRRRSLQTLCSAVSCRVQQLRYRYFYRWLRRTWRPGHSRLGDRLRAVVFQWRSFTYAPRPNSKLVSLLRDRFEANLRLHCTSLDGAACRVSSNNLRANRKRRPSIVDYHGRIESRDNVGETDGTTTFQPDNKIKRIC